MMTWVTWVSQTWGRRLFPFRNTRDLLLGPLNKDNHLVDAACGSKQSPGACSQRSKEDVESHCLEKKVRGMKPYRLLQIRHHPTKISILVSDLNITFQRSAPYRTPVHLPVCFD